MDPKREHDHDIIALSIELSERDLSDARRLLSLLVRARGDAGTPDGDAIRTPREMLVHRARLELRSRRSRSRHFPRGMFGEPAWEMLLVLYVAEKQTPTTIRRLIDRSGLSHTTALRWLDYLESQ